VLYIIDGMSRAGKTTAIQEIVPIFQDLLPTETFRWRPQEMGQDFYWATMLEKLEGFARDPQKLWIADRLHMSEFVYGILDKKEFPYLAWVTLDNALAQAGAWMAFCSLSTTETYRRCSISSRNPEGDPDEVRRLWHIVKDVTYITWKEFSGDCPEGDLAKKLFRYGVCEISDFIRLKGPK
jgi:hypothetical protein